MSEPEKLQDPLAKAAGTKTGIDAPDPEFYAKLTELVPILATAPQDPNDHLAAREWLKSKWFELPRVVQAERFQSPITCRTEDITVTYNGDNQFQVRVYQPDLPSTSTNELLPAVLLAHGGGWVHGNLETDDETAKYFCSELRAVIINVDYRLAPEHPFPAPHDDLYEALNWTIANASKYSINPHKIALWGCSAGANLSAGVALRDSESGPSRIAHLTLLVPPTCHPKYFPDNYVSAFKTMNAEQSAAAEPLLGVWEKYAAGNVDHKYVAVLTATPTKNHPPTLVTVAGQDLLSEEGIAYYLHLRNAGVDSQLDIVPGVPHGIFMVPTAAVVLQFWRDQTRALMWGLGIVPEGKK